MNILFLLRSLDSGGLEIVTSVLANKFTKEGHHVCVFAFERRSGMLVNRLDKNVKVIVAGKYSVTDENVSLLRQQLITNEIQIVINQWGLPLIPIRTLLKARKGLDIKVISVYHNNPLKNGRIQNVEIEIRSSKNVLRKIYLYAKKFVFRCVTGFSMRYNYHHSDLYVVLSSSYINHFCKFTRMSDAPKLIAIDNPLTIDTDDFEYQSEEKQCELIYIGRLDSTQKCTNRIIEVWKSLEPVHPEWRLTIVGDGNEKDNLEYLISKMDLKNVIMEGFQNPRPYYERASILLLTSDFEGFPLVLVEGMSFGVVPVVYGSFSAVYDIIENGKNGVIIPQTSFGFNAALMAESLQALMVDKTLLDNMAQHAIEKSKKFSIDKAYQEWMKVMQ